MQAPLTEYPLADPQHHLCTSRVCMVRARRSGKLLSQVAHGISVPRSIMLRNVRATCTQRARAQKSKLCTACASVHHTIPVLPQKDPDHAAWMPSEPSCPHPIAYTREFGHMWFQKAAVLLSKQLWLRVHRAVDCQYTSSRMLCKVLTAEKQGSHRCNASAFSDSVRAIDLSAPSARSRYRQSSQHCHIRRLQFGFWIYGSPPPARCVGTKLL